MIPEILEKTILSICEENGAFRPCEKRKNTTELKTIWIEQNYTEEIKMCCLGFKKVDEVCTPICSNACENAVCVAPDKCKCNDGFIRDKKEYESIPPKDKQRNK